jgi:hypothetical protein
LKITIEANKKIVDYFYLDVTFILTTETHQPYMKPGNKPIYVNVKSNQHKSVLQAIPEGVNTRLNEEIFNKAEPEYQTTWRYHSLGI